MSKASALPRATLPRTNLTGDPYFTDGLRLVLFISDKPTDAADVDYLEWEEPIER
jgi:hypothetical protein